MGLIVDGWLGTRSAAVLSLYGFGGPRLRVRQKVTLIKHLSSGR